MALIQCSECGQMVSDKASICPKCGAPIERKVVCKECGKEMNADADQCPNCGCPNPEKNIQKSTATQTSFNVGGNSDEKQKRVQRYLMENRGNFPANRIEELRKWMLSLSDTQLEQVECLDFKDPKMLLVLSIFLGALGIDRFILGDVQNGVFKLLLTLLCGIGFIWWLIDLFSITDRTMQYNYKMMKDTLKYV